MGGQAPLVGALGKKAHEKRKRDDAAKQQRRRDKLALEGLTSLTPPLTPLDCLSDEALAKHQQVQDSRQWIGGAWVKKPRAGQDDAG